MRRTDFYSMSTDELLDFHEEVAATLARKLIAKKTALEELQKHLSQLTPQTRAELLATAFTNHARAAPNAVHAPRSR